MVEVQGLCFAYNKSAGDVLHDVSFRLEDGKCLAILGNNGAGKSTLIKCIDRICPAREGRVLVDGETGRGEYNLSARTNGGRLVHLKGAPELIGKFIEAEITDGNTWALYGVPAD